jgi:hypothetical protein
MDPASIADQSDDNPAGRDKPFDAPAPGVPVSDEEYDRLKRRAKTARLPPSEHSQEDPSGKRRK